MSAKLEGMLCSVIDCNKCICRFVGTFISRKDRMKDMGHNTRFTNLYVKNFGEEITDDDLSELFAKFGKIVSAVVMKDRNNGKSMGYGFVSFEEHPAAQSVSILRAVCASYFITPLLQALESMNSQKVSSGQTLYVSRAQKKKERQQELMRRHEAEKMERYSRLDIPCVVISGTYVMTHQVPGSQSLCEELGGYCR